MPSLTSKQATPPLSGKRCTRAMRVSQQKYNVSCAELDLLVDVARQNAASPGRA
jgi:galactokinase